ncbi:hypothetical protein Tco_0839663 [Tanacetum coccineum]|uniref:Retrovirus-related Pol polyprotein from transposon TNT 1-94-like beta-barrel domain-containing protein n=1 Tax=Tanacetum coccineum TaxID=301880 RepID=A0ABQ5ASE8_9ASTR
MQRKAKGKYAPRQDAEKYAAVLEKYSREVGPSGDSSGLESMATTLDKQGTMTVYEGTRRHDHNDSLTQHGNQISEDRKSRGSTLKIQSTAEPSKYPQKDILKLFSSKSVPSAPTAMEVISYEQMEYDLKIRDLKLEEKQKELDQALKERDDFKVKLEKWSNASVLQNEVLNKQRYVSDKSCIGFGIESSNSMESNISSGTIIPPRANVSFTGIDELAIRNKVVDQEKTKSSQSAIDRNKVIIEDWVDSDDEETDVSESQKETAFPNHLIKDCNLHERTFQKHQTRKLRGHRVLREPSPVWITNQRVIIVISQETLRYFSPMEILIPSAKLLTRMVLIGNRPVLSRSTDGSFYPRMDNRKSRSLLLSISRVLPQIVKKRAMINPKQTWKPKGNYLDYVNRGNGSYTLKQFEYGNPDEDSMDYAIIDSGCSGSMTGDKDQLSDFKEFKGGYVAFGNDSKGGRISGKGTITDILALGL